jgi:hypothetical protein
MEDKIDLLTGEHFIPKRANQKFATPLNRVQYYNQKANNIRHHKSNFDKPLHRNYNILTELLEGKKSAIFHKQFLIGKGYNFEVYTHIVEIEGKRQFAIYNFVILHENFEKIKLLRHD